MIATAPLPNLTTATQPDLTTVDYHAHPAISRTGLKCFRESRRLYHARHVLRLPEAQMEPTPAMNLGTLCHAELLEPGSLEGQFAILPDEFPDFRTKAAKQWRDEQQAAGRIVVKRQEIAAQKAIVQSAAATVGTWLGDDAAIVEQPLFWKDVDSGLPCRCKPDWLINRRDVVWACDFKTTADCSPYAFGRQIASLELWLQDEHYSRGVRANFPGKPVVFLFVVTEKTFPFRTAVHQVDRTFGAHDRIVCEYDRTLDAIKQCERTENWAEPWEGEIIKVKLRDNDFLSDSLIVR